MCDRFDLLDRLDELRRFEFCEGEGDVVDRVNVEQSAAHHRGKFSADGQLADTGVAVQDNDHVREPIIEYHCDTIDGWQ